MKSLYRKYRPLRLEDVVSQEQVTTPLISAIKSGKVNHAYLFIGPRGCGKTSVARILAHEINGFSYKLEDDYVDIIEIDGASNRGIDNIRELREKVMIAPTSGKYKVYIIDEVHMLTKEAFNALLKTLEEPPEHVVFIMATTDAYKVPITITSRAQTFTFRLAERKVMQDYLRSICDKEGIKIDDDAIAIIAKRGGGSFRDSLSLLDQISTLPGDKITKESIVDAMGLPDDEKIQSLLDLYGSGDISSITKLVRELFSAGIKPETLAEEMIYSIIDTGKPYLFPLLDKLVGIKAPYADARLLVALTECGTDARPVTAPQSRPATVSLPRPATVSLPRPASPEQSTQTVIEHTPSAYVAPAKSDESIHTQETATKTNTPSDTPAPSGSDFDWNTFTENVHSKNSAVYMQLSKSNYEYTNGCLHIYPTKKISKTILDKDQNRQLLSTIAGGVKITVHDIDEKPSGAPKNDTLSKLSAIMGGEVTKDGGENPF